MIDQHLENLGTVGWIMLILLCAVVYLYDEKKSIQRSNETVSDYKNKQHQIEIDKLKTEISELKKQLKQ